MGAGGAGFPTYAKFGSPADYLLMNAAECEPLLRVDQQLLAMYTDEILKGFDMAAKAAGVKKAIIGIKVKHHEVIDLLRKRIGELGMDIEVGELPDIYPAGDEQVLVYQLTGRVVPGSRHSDQNAADVSSATLRQSSISTEHLRVRL